MSDCYIVSLKWTKRDTPYITVWRPEDSGYAWPLPWAGKYSTEQVRANRNYYHRGDDTLAVPCEVIDALGEAPTKGMIDGNVGPVVLNNRANWNAILAGALPDPLMKPKPQIPRVRRAA
jgi:hypothetical protein